MGIAKTVAGKSLDDIKCPPGTTGGRTNGTGHYKRLDELTKMAKYLKAEGDDSSDFR